MRFGGLGANQKFEGLIMDQVAIKSISVEGLHDQYNVELNLKPDLNVIYGKNGEIACEFDIQKTRPKSPHD